VPYGVFGRTSGEQAIHDAIENRDRALKTLRYNNVHPMQPLTC
jgi:flavin-binding protein dodecin